MLRDRSHALLLLGIAGVVAATGCDSGGSSGGSPAATATGSSTAPPPSGSSASPVTTRGVTDLRDPGPVVTGAIPVGYKLVDPTGAAADLTVAFSTDGGATWQAASDGPGGDGRSGLSTGAAPGADHVYVWDSAADIPAEEPSVHLRVAVAGGTGEVAGPFAVDNRALSTAVRLTRFPYLQSTTRTSTIVAWRSESDSDSLVEYGETAALGQVAGDPSARTKVHAVALTGLKPGTRYFYRIVSAGAPITRRLTLETAPDPGQKSEVTFLAFGDSGKGTAEQFALAAQMNAEDVDFVIHTGDVIYPAGALLDPVGRYDQLFFRPYRQLIARSPIFPSIGNHDWMAPMGAPYREAFYLPENNAPDPVQRELYYAFEWGDVKMISLETYGLFRSPRGPHMDWLRRELNTSARWTIVFMHVPLFSAGKHGDDTALQGLLGPLFENNGVDLVIAGHDHDYERTVPIRAYSAIPGDPGITHVVTGAAGEVRNITPNARSAVALSAFHYLKCTVRGDQLHGVAVGLQGAVIDQFTISTR